MKTKTRTHSSLIKAIILICVLVSVGALLFISCEGKEMSLKKLKNLFEIIKHCLNKTGTEYTPSDYGENNLSLDELEKINEIVQNL